jgi:hypothetical protein
VDIAAPMRFAHHARRYTRLARRARAEVGRGGTAGVRRRAPDARAAARSARSATGGIRAINGRYEKYEDEIDAAVVDNAAVPRGARPRVALGCRRTCTTSGDLGAHMRRDDRRARDKCSRTWEEIDEGLRQLARLPRFRLPPGPPRSVRVRSRASARVVRAVLEDESAISAQQTLARSSRPSPGCWRRRLVPLARQRYAAALRHVPPRLRACAWVGGILAPSFVSVVLAGTSS